MNRSVIDPTMDNYIHFQVGDETIYPSQTSNGETVEVWEWMNTLVPHLLARNHSFILGLKLVRVSKMGLR